LPFFDLSKLTPDNLLGISNFLKNEAVNYHHSILHLFRQYEATYAQLENVNRIRMAKVALTDSMEVDDHADKGEGSSSAVNADK